MGFCDYKMGNAVVSNGDYVGNNRYAPSVLPPTAIPPLRVVKTAETTRAKTSQANVRQKSLRRLWALLRPTTEKLRRL